jgi:uncharacterized membrane protein YphA (DoxX/SURF4 family)
MAIAFLIGRIVLGAYYLYNGYNHLKNIDFLAGYTASKGVPAPKLAVVGTGLMMLGGGLSILLGLQPYLGALLLIVFLLPTAFLMHNYWTVSDPQARMGEQINFLKDLALAASTMMFLAIPAPWALSLGM